MRRVLITGGTGFVGALCRQRLIDHGDEVHVLSRQRGMLTGCQFHTADILDTERVEEIIAVVRPTHLLHLAWITTPGVYWTSPENHAWVAASTRLVEVFRKYGGRRVVAIGSCAEYDWSRSICDEETTPCRPVTLYGHCKNNLHERLKTMDVDLAWARLFYLFGPAEHPSRLVSSVVLSLMRGEPALCTAGTQQRDFLSTFDVADALVQLLHSDAVGAFNVASGQAVMVKQVVETVADLLGVRRLVCLGARPMPAYDPPLIVASIDRLTRTLGWKPGLSLEEGLAKTVAWWRGQRLAA